MVLKVVVEISEFSPLSLPELGAFLMDKARELLSGQLLSLGFAHPDPLIDLVQDTIIGTMLSGPLKELLNNAGMNTFPNEPCRNALHELGINMELYAKAETLRAWWENWENFTSAYKEICPCTTNTELQKIQKYKEHWTENTNLMKKYLEQSHKKAVSLCR